MSRFRTRQMYPRGFSFWRFFSHQFWNSIHLIVVFTIVGIIAFALFDRSAQAQEPLSFHFVFPFREIKIPFPGYWQLSQKDDAGYKNERIRFYQDLLKDRGVSDRETLKLLTAQLLQENGALAEDRDGDHGCSIGIPQYNACAHHRMNAKRYREIHPEWNDWRFQMTWMADQTVKTLQAFDGNAKCAIIHHNRPASAYNGCRDTAAGYYRNIVSRSSLLSYL